MFSFIKKYRNRRLREKITLAYLSNPVSSAKRDEESDFIHINLLCLNIKDPIQAHKILRDSSNE